MIATDFLITRYFNSFDGKNGRTIQPLPKQEELKLFRRWKRNKDKAALDKLILSNLKFVVKCANKFKRHADGKAIDINDLIQAGNEGLMEAIIRFKPQKGFRLITFAVHWINAYIRNFIYFNSSTVRVGLNNLTKVLLDQKWSNYALLNGKDSDAIHVWREAFKKKYKVSAKKMQAEEEKLQTVGSIFSMDKEHLDYDSDNGTMHNKLFSDQFNVERLVENKNEQDLISARVRSALKSIPQRDRDILQQRFGINNLSHDIDIVTLKQCGKNYNVSRQRIQQVERCAMKLMKQELEKDPAIQEIVGLV